MPFRLSLLEGGTFFFTVNLADRKADLLASHVDDLRAIVRLVRQRHFKILAMVVSPEHIHTISRMPAGDAVYPRRWALIKADFTRRLPKIEAIRASRVRKRERGI